MFDLPPRSSSGDDPTVPDPLALDRLDLHWQMLVGRDRRPTGVRLELHHRHPGEAEAVGAVLEGIVQGLSADESIPAPQGLILVAPVGGRVDPGLSTWKAPRNVLLEVDMADLGDEARARVLFESRAQGLRQALRLPAGVPVSVRLQYFQYVVGSPAAAPKAGIPLLADSCSDLAAAEAALAAGAHAVVGWPLVAAANGDRRELNPSQKAIFELVRLIQSDADLRALEKVFEAEPLLAYMLLTLANSAAFRRGSATASLRQAISNIGYQRLVKWLVLILAISAKEGGFAPAIFTTIVRGYCMENLCAAAGRVRSECDESFVVGAFSLLDAITGVPLAELMGEVGLPAAVSDALLRREGPYAGFYETTLALEGAANARFDASATGMAAGDINRSLLKAIAAADTLLALI